MAAASSFAAWRSKSARVPLKRLRRVARERDAIDGKHLAADQALVVTDGEDRREHAGDVVVERADERRDRGERGGAVAAERDEGHVLLAGALDAATADDALRVREQHHLQQHRGRIRRGPGRVVPEAGVEMRQVDLVVEQMIQRMLERPGQELPRQVDGQEARVRIDVFVAGHVGGLDGTAPGLHIRCSGHPTSTHRVPFPHRVFRGFSYNLVRRSDHALPQRRMPRST